MGRLAKFLCGKKRHTLEMPPPHFYDEILAPAEKQPWRTPYRDELVIDGREQ
jgi:hypothetical protein